MLTILLRAAAWLSLAAIVLATVVPIGLRPSTATPVALERFAAYAVVAFLFCSAYPRRILVAVVFVMAVAGALELAQFLSPTRHPRFSDLFVKIVGVGFGALVSVSAASLRRRPDC